MVGWEGAGGCGREGCFETECRWGASLLLLLGTYLVQMPSLQARSRDDGFGSNQVSKATAKPLLQLLDEAGQHGVVVVVAAALPSGRPPLVLLFADRAF